MPSVGMGIREYTSSWISGARVLFSVALSISLTPRPLTSHLSWAKGGGGVTEIGSVLLFHPHLLRHRQFFFFKLDHFIFNLKCLPTNYSTNSNKVVLDIDITADASVAPSICL